MPIKEKIQILPPEILPTLSESTQRQIELIGQYAYQVDILARELRGAGNLETGASGSNVGVCVTKGGKSPQLLSIAVKYEDGGYLNSLQIEATEKQGSPWHRSFLQWDSIQDTGMGPLRRGVNDLVVNGPFFKIDPHIPFVPSGYGLPTTDADKEVLDALFGKIRLFSEKLLRGKQINISDNKI